MKTKQRVEQRSKEAVATLFVEMLKVPSIFFDARWPSSADHVDMLAIDRAGVGDIHVVEIKKTLDEAIRAAKSMLLIPAQFRWVAFYNPDFHKLEDDKMGRKAQRAPLFAIDGMGRVGIIEVYDEESQFGDRLEASVLVRAERFAGSLYDEADKFVAAHKADIMFR